MTVKQVTCFIAECDDCGSEYEHDYTPHWPTARESIDNVMDNADWWSDGREALLCRDCAEKPHAFIASDQGADGCTRCPHPAEEHGEVVAP